LSDRRATAEMLNFATPQPRLDPSSITSNTRPINHHSSSSSSSVADKQTPSAAPSGSRRSTIPTLHRHRSPSVPPRQHCRRTGGKKHCHNPIPISRQTKIPSRQLHSPQARFHRHRGARASPRHTRSIDPHGPAPRTHPPSLFCPRGNPLWPYLKSQARCTGVRSSGRQARRPLISRLTYRT
jgi:hypothetical protein